VSLSYRYIYRRIARSGCRLQVRHCWLITRTGIHDYAKLVHAFLLGFDGWPCMSRSRVCIMSLPAGYITIWGMYTITNRVAYTRLRNYTLYCTRIWRQDEIWR